MRKKITEELERPTVEEFQEIEKLPVTVVVDNVRSALNVGSIFRTADAFLIERIIICGISQTPPSKEIHKTALGAEMSVSWEYSKNVMEAINSLKGNGYTVVSIEQTTDSTSLESFEPVRGEKYALVAGNEVDGVTESVVESSDISLEIPQMGTKHSLNVSIATGIVMWHFFRALK